MIQQSKIMWIRQDSYISNLWLIAKDISDYIDDGKMSDLSDAKEGIVLIPTYQD